MVINTIPAKITSMPTIFRGESSSPINIYASKATRNAFAAVIATVGPAGPFDNAILIAYMPIASAMPANIGKRRSHEEVLFKFSEKLLWYSRRKTNPVTPVASHSTIDVNSESMLQCPAYFTKKFVVPNISIVISAYIHHNILGRT